MKIYVDELPKDCWDCPMHDGENGWCKILVCYTDYIPKDCPLQSISDYTKQVRKEVCEEIKERLKKANLEIMSPIGLYSYTDNFLYQVEKERKGE